MAPKKKKSLKKKAKGKSRGSSGNTEGYATRTRYPTENEVLGVIIRNFGDRRMSVLCEDKVTRVARIPGRFRRGYRIQTGDLVIVEPWSDMGGERGDIVHRFVHQEIRNLAKNPRLRKILEELQVPIPRQQEDEFPY